MKQSVIDEFMSVILAPHIMRSFRIAKPKPKVALKCALPGCNVMTTHNGGFCCREHCIEYKQRKGISA